MLRLGSRMVGRVSAYLKDAIIVLGCKVADSGRVVGALRRRCERAAAAHRERIAPVILACGGKRWPGGVEAVQMRAELLQLGVPAAAIYCETVSESTWGNAVHGARVLHALGARRVALVTCDFHQARARSLFHDAGFDCIGLACTTPLPSSARRAWRTSREGFFRLLQPKVRWGR